MGFPIFYVIQYTLVGIALTLVPHHIFVPVPSQDLDFQCHISWFFLCSVSQGEMWLFVLLILMELLTVTV
jgi:hypothetical protein